MNRFCSRCKNEIEYRPHRRTGDLCDSCYQTKRNEDVKKNMRKLRTGSTELKPKKVKQDDTRLWGLEKFLERFDLKIVEHFIPVYPQYKSGYIVLNAIVELQDFPKGWKVEYFENKTKLSYEIDPNIEDRYQLALHNLLNNLDSYFRRKAKTEQELQLEDKRKNIDYDEFVKKLEDAVRKAAD